MDKKPTLKSIAIMAGLSVTTVSKALRDAPDISESTKERLKLIAEQVGYQPDKAALRLKTGKTNTICFVMEQSEGHNFAFSEFITGISKALRPTGYNLLIQTYLASEGPMERIRDLVSAQVADGIILDRVQGNDQRLAYIKQAGIPVATYGRSQSDLEHAYYDFDCVKFGRDAVRLLGKLNCKRLCMILPDMHATYAQLTEEGYHQGIRESQLEDYVVDSRSLDNSIEAIAAHAYSVLKDNNRPDGFVCGSIKSVLGVLAGVSQAGLSIGDGVEVVARQSITNELRHTGKPIYYIGDNTSEAGYTVANSLIAVIDGAPISDHQTVQYTDVIGQNVLESVDAIG